MSSDVVIQVEGLSKQYRLGEVSTGSLGHDFNRWWHRVRGKEDPYLKVTQTNVREKKVTTENAEGAEKRISGGALSSFLRHSVSSVVTVSASASDYVWALRDINFEVQRGEVLGIIGRNGAGKSTLLKILSRVTAPTTGEVRVKGRIASLLEIGTGFHHDLTGRENIYLNGAILGMTKPEIASKLDEIVDFSGCARYIDTPVKRYSSGMMVRLGFAVAAHLEPEILIVDEVLAVGDAEFQKKCIGKMQDVASHGRTVLFVSHNMGSIQNLCNSAIWVDAGRIVNEKDAAERIVSSYERGGCINAGVVDFAPEQHRVISSFQIERLEILGRADHPGTVLKYGESVRLRLVCSCRESFTGLEVGIAVRSHGLVLSTLLSPPQCILVSQKGFVLQCTIPGGTLLPGVFELDVGASRFPGNIGLDYVRSAATFAVSEAGVDRDWTYNRKQYGLIRFPVEWSQP